jgi:UDP-glucose 4-epimerase
MLEGKTLLVTGGTGSFGNAVVDRFLATGIREVRIFRRDEKKQDDMRVAYQSERLKFLIGDVRSADSLRAALEGVDYVFHAAALKQVPSCEFFPMEAVRTNVVGTDNLIGAAVDAGVKAVIALSTDKAVYPVNAMGMSKALMEKVMVARARDAEARGTLVCGTRYGNVIASRGSVIPLFVSQIKAGKPLTVTDPGMTRFIMSLENAVDLVLHAYGNARPGDIFVQKAPACTIGDLAQALLELFGARNEVKVIGTRHGEKRHETLLHREEMARAEDQGGYYRIPADTRDLNYAKYFVEGEQRITQRQDYDSDNAKRLGVREIRDLLATVPYVRGEMAR